jgi:hypothetical protein
MQTHELNERVRLIRDVPELFLETGLVGIVQSVWFAPTPAYEVEFQPGEGKCPIRALLMAEHLQSAEVRAGRAARDGAKTGGSLPREIQRTVKVVGETIAWGTETD